jgi:hypothetical protein
MGYLPAAVFLALWLLSGPVSAQSAVPANPNDPPNPIEAAETELVISGWHSTGATYLGNLRLTARDGKVHKFSFSTSDFRRHEDGMVYPSLNVGLEGDFQVGPDPQKDFKIKVTGLELPGTYKGKIKIVPQETRQEITLNLTVNARPAQMLTTLTANETIKLNLTEGNNFLVKLLLPKADWIKQKELVLKNSYQIPAELVEAKIVLNGQQTTYQLAGQQLRIDQIPQNLGSSFITTIPLKICRSAIPPDQYKGIIFLKCKGDKEVLQLPVELTMRRGPGLVACILLLGIFLGWFIKFMQDRGLPLARAMNLIFQLEGRIQEADQADQDILNPMLYEVRDLLYRGKLEPDKVGEKLTAIENRLELLNKLRKIEERLKTQSAPPPGALPKLRECRQAVHDGDDARAKEIWDELQNLLGAGGLVADRKLKKLSSAANRYMDLLLPTPTGKTVPEPSWSEKIATWFYRRWPRIRSLLIYYPGVIAFYVTVMGVMLFVGLTILYLKNPTFGVNYTDYLSLIFWGLSSDVATRNLQNLLAAAKLAPK